MADARYPFLRKLFPIVFAVALLLRLGTCVYKQKRAAEIKMLTEERSRMTENTARCPTECRVLLASSALPPNMPLPTLTQCTVSCEHTLKNDPKADFRGQFVTCSGPCVADAGALPSTILPCVDACLGH
jgi:hypothetical protein